MTDKDNDFVTVARVGDIGAGSLMYVEVGDQPVCLINIDGDYYALGDVCTHGGASLADGQILGEELECPLHGGAYDICTGQPVGLPVVAPAETFRVRVLGDEVQVVRGG